MVDLINKTNFIAHAKRFIEESNVTKMEIVHLEEKDWEERTNVNSWQRKDRKCRHWKQFDEKSKDKKWIWRGTAKK